MTESWDAKSRGMRSWAEASSASESRAASVVGDGDEVDDFVSADEGRDENMGDGQAGERDEETFREDVVGDAPPDDARE
eukprot:11667520-Alexandrium_andersonii.AAC.1